MATRRKKKAGTAPTTETETTEPTGEPSLDLEPGIAWGNVIRDTLKVGNPVALAARLRDELILTEAERSSYSAILKALDAAAKNHDDSYLLYRVAKLEDQRFMIDVRDRLEVMRSAALQELMDEYKAKTRKSPTNDDIEDRMVVNWGDEYRHIQRRKNELHAAMRTLENLAKAWASRCQDLRVMAGMFSNNRKG